MIVAPYVRVSTQHQAVEGYSIEEQIARTKDYASAMGWQIIKVYSDPGVSGATLNRPGLQELLQDIRAGLIDTVLVYKLDRLSRSQKDTLKLIEDDFLGHGVNFVSMSENFDTSSPFGRAMIGILSVFAQLEREQIKERMSMGKDARAKTGKWGGGARVPFGYDYNPEIGHLTVNEYEAEQVKRLFSMYTSGYSLHSIENAFSDDGITIRGNRLGLPTMRYILGNNTYIGVIKRKGQNFPGMQEPIIDTEIFNRAQILLQKGKDDYIKKTRFGRNSGLLTGLLKCAECGANYHRNSIKPGQVFYSCYSRSKKVKGMIADPNCHNKNWPVEKLDNIILNEIKKLSIDPSIIEEIRDKKKESAPDILGILDAREKKTRAALSRYMDLYALEKIDFETIKEKTKPLQKELDAIANEKKRLSEEQNKEDYTKELIDSIPEVIENSTPEQLRALVRGLIERIDLDGEKISIHWKL